GDALVRLLFNAFHAFLTPGCPSVCPDNWMTTAGNGDGPEARKGEDDTTVLVIERESLDSVADVATWIRDGGIARARPACDCAIADWLDDFASRSVEQVVFGYVLMARSQRADDGVFRARERVTSAPANNPHRLAVFLTTVFAIRSWLASAGPEEIAATVFTRS